MAEVAAQQPIVVPDPSDTVAARIIRIAGKLPVNLFLAAIGLVWLVPTIGLFLSSLLAPNDFNSKGWWQIISKPSVAVRELTAAPRRSMDSWRVPGEACRPHDCQTFCKSACITLPARAGSERSMNPSLSTARRPISSTARAAASMWKYMSLKLVVPDLIISMHASFVPQ